MTSRPRSGPNSYRHRSRDFDSNYPPLSPRARFPALRTLNSPRSRNSVSSTLPPSQRLRTATWSTVAARRAERIRNHDERLPSPHEDSMDRYIWPSTSRRAGHMRNAAEGHPAANLDDLDRSLDEANTHLRALLDLTTQAHLSPLMPPLSTPPAPPPPPVRSHDFPDDHRRNKRRKLDLDRAGPGTPVFRYGRYGQVEAGQLRMEIVSCDGGIFLNEALYAAENILRNDCSVYCTKGNRCNVVLRHQGGTVFTLQELIIKAPARTSYSHPVREGMVFIAMDQDDMLSRTAQYQIQYGQPPQSRSSSGRGGPGAPPGSGDDPSGGRHIISIRHHDDGSTSTTRARRSWVYRADEDDENRVPQMPREFAANLPDFRVSTECSDDEEDEAFAGARPFRGPPNIGSLPFENQDSDLEDLADPFSSDDPADDLLLLHHSRRQALHRARHEQRERERHREREAQMSLAEAYDAHANATQEAVRAVGGGELLVPHARFFIEKKKSKCTIKFDPPVSGRFILLKMWSSQHDPGSNIDIQSVMARGFAGPRYFPVVESR